MVRRTSRKYRPRRPGSPAPGRCWFRELATEVRAVVHKGISDEEYVATLKVLRKMVVNVEGGGTPDVRV
ncbi:hypothetical protein [Streptomyces albogriseolus]|uniref:hypothetical protein n=1 Tax=Streptomyces albogriseolus TaxID=1887 RepID=UPI00382EED3A